MQSLRSRFLQLPVTLTAVAVLTIRWWMRAGRDQGDRWPRVVAGRPALALPAVAAGMLVPWTIGIAIQLPHTALAYHWNTAWTGLDIAIMTGLALTSWLGRRADRRVALTATATATLMCADAWFDVCTSGSGHPFAYAVTEAATELAVAAACLLIALRNTHINAEAAPGERAGAMPESAKKSPQCESLPDFTPPTSPARLPART
jgi:hypothetical protein